MAQKTYNFAILGSGNVAKFHAEAISSLEEANLIGVADSDFGRAETFAEKYGIKPYASYDEMLADPEVDAVCICTPSGCHAEQAIQALRCGKHTVLEKPMALNTEDADRIVEEAEKAEALITVISQNRFLPDVQKAKEIVESGKLGKLVFCDLFMKYWRDPEYYSASDWRGTFKHDGGGALINQGIHGVDMMLYIVGDAKPSFAKIKTSYHNIEAEDTALAILDFENGASGVIEASTCAYPGFNRRIEIMGTKGSMIISEGHIEKLVIGSETVIEGAVEKRGSSADHTVMDTSNHARQIQNLIDAINGKEPIFIDAKEARRPLKLIEEIYSYRNK